MQLVDLVVRILKLLLQVNSHFVEILGNGLVLGDSVLNLGTLLRELDIKSLVKLFDVDLSRIVQLLHLGLKFLAQFD